MSRTCRSVQQRPYHLYIPPSIQHGSEALEVVGQAATRPPTFVFFVNDAKLFTDEYKRYMDRQLRDNIGFPGTPLRIFWRGKEPTKREPRSAPYP